ncbi:MAG: hypothetical protein KF809_04010 [Chloroflexi bacterium]|nr:hypothetical protein [Chloroflexota bacterium]
MRTTVDLPPAVRARALEVAAARGMSVSATIAELTSLGSERLDEPVTTYIDERSGFPVMRFGRRITMEDVVAALDDE